MRWQVQIAGALLGCLLPGTFAAAQPENAPAPAPAGQRASARAVSTGRYFIEFRVAEVGTYGHSYVA
jgi:hypothetical protein